VGDRFLHAGLTAEKGNMRQAGGPFGAALGPREISRRDVLNGLLLAAGSAAVCQSVPFRALAAEATGEACDGSIGADPRTLRGGNLPSTFNVAHWMRDQRLRFENGGVKLLPGCDEFDGAFPISDEGKFDVIIVGAGLAGLSAAYFLLRRRPETRILLLEANPYAGGNAGRDSAAPLPVTAPTGGAYCYEPFTDPLIDLYRELKIDWQKQTIPDPGDCYYFDEYAPGVRPGYRGWNIDTTGDGMASVPYEEKVVEDLLKSKDELIAFTKQDDGMDDPPDNSAESYDYLSAMTLDHYLTNVKGYDPVVSDFHSLYTIDALGGESRYVNAHSGISFLSYEYVEGLITFVGGSSELAIRIVQWLAGPDYKSRHPPRIELSAVALRVDANTALSKADASVGYFKDRSFHRATAKAVIVAAQSQSARHLVEHLMDAERKAAWSLFNTVPVVIANVALRSAAPFHELGLGYSQAWWGSRYWANLVVADWVTERRNEPDRPTVLTFFGGNRAAPEELPNERVKLLQTPFSAYEESLKDDLSRILRGSTFDFDRDVTAIFLYRWGHSMIMPTPNGVFGNVRKPNGRLDRSKAPRRVACRPLGPILFAGQHTEGTPSVESAIMSGHRTAQQALARL
jgi:spermidine dehydrogenase